MIFKTVERKSKVLTEPKVECLKGILTVNLTRGCLHACTYCYARAFPETPKGEVWFFSNTLEGLKNELNRLYLKGRLPKEVSLSTASDAFQPHPEVKKTATSVIRLLLEKGIRVSFLTKGIIPEELFPILKDGAELVRATVGMITVSEELRRTLEPGASPTTARLRQVERLLSQGVKTEVRVDPLIPGVTDSPELLESLFKRLKALGIKSVTCSYLMLRPGIIKNLKRELPLRMFFEILKHYENGSWKKVITSEKTLLVKREVREERYEALRELARTYEIEVKICRCKNPDLNRGVNKCLRWDGFPREGTKQLEFF